MLVPFGLGPQRRHELVLLGREVGALKVPLGAVGQCDLDVDLLVHSVDSWWQMMLVEMGWSERFLRSDTLGVREIPAARTHGLGSGCAGASRESLACTTDRGAGDKGHSVRSR